MIKVITLIMNLFFQVAGKNTQKLCEYTYTCIYFLESFLKAVHKAFCPSGPKTKVWFFITF